jgi:hypothetical protein
MLIRENDEAGYLGLFGYIGSNGVVRNLKLEEVDITAIEEAGRDTFNRGLLAGFC